MNDFRDRQIRAAMEALGKLWYADRIGVWELDGEVLGLACDNGLSRRDRQLAREAWDSERTRLRQGLVLDADGAEFQPLMAPRQDLLGFVQVFRPRPQPSNAQLEALVDRALSYLAWALRLTQAPLAAERAPASTAATIVATRDPRQAELLPALSRCGWSYAELARRWGVTRQTIYNRVRAAGLEPPPPFDRRHRRRS